MTLRTRLNELDDKAGIRPRYERDVTLMMIGGLWAFMSASNLVLVLGNRDDRYATLLLVLDLVGVLLGLAVVALGFRWYRARTR
jgi:hypothetical protein